MPVEEFLQRQADFELLVVDVLNTHLEPDDDDFEKSLKLFDYISVNYTYQYEFIEQKHDCAIYLAILERTGQCVELAAVYSYFLLQAGVEAIAVGGHAPTMDHEWTYLMINGKGYYSDPTWALRSETGTIELDLYYFLMSADRRAESGFQVDDLTAPLLPKYWLNRSSIKLDVSEETLCFPSGSFLQSLDEANKTVHYTCNGENLELQYALAQ